MVDLDAEPLQPSIGLGHPLLSNYEIPVGTDLEYKVEAINANGIGPPATYYQFQRDNIPTTSVGAGTSGCSGYPPEEAFCAGGGCEGDLDLCAIANVGGTVRARVEYSPDNGINWHKLVDILGPWPRSAGTTGVKFDSSFPGPPAGQTYPVRAKLQLNYPPRMQIVNGQQTLEYEYATTSAAGYLGYRPPEAFYGLTETPHANGIFNGTNFAIDPVNKFAYLPATDNVAVVDLATYLVVKNIPITNGAVATVVMNTAQTKAYALSSPGIGGVHTTLPSTIAEIDLTQQAVTQTLTHATNPVSFSASGRFITAVELNGKIYSGGQANYMSVVNIATGAKTGIWTAGQVVVVAADPVNNRVFVSVPEQNKVMVIDATNDTVIANTLGLNMKAFSLAVLPALNRLYVGSNTDYKVLIYNTTTLANVGQVNFGGGSFGAVQSPWPLSMKVVANSFNNCWYALGGDIPLLRGYNAANNNAALTMDNRPDLTNRQGPVVPTQFISATMGFSFNRFGLYYTHFSSATATPYSVAGLITVAGSKQVTLSWTAPTAEAGYLPVSDYIVQYTADGATWSTFNDGISTNTSVVIANLTSGIGYLFRVAALNQMGIGPYVTTPSATTPS